MRDRKGEHLHILEGLRAQGFVRARIDNIVVDLDDAPALEKNKKHTIEVVIDRFKVRPDLALRLAESFETSLRLADGVAQVAFMDTGKTKKSYCFPLVIPVSNVAMRWAI